MKKQLIIILLTAFISGTLCADQYIVKKDGSATWAVGTKQKGDSVVYTEKSTGNEVKVLVSKLDGVIPKVKRGKKYSKEYIEKQVTKLKKLARKHQKLRRSLNQMLQEWEMLTKPSTEIENGIPKFEKAFMNSEKGTTDFKTAQMGLGMLKYKDMSGTYTEKIDGALKRVLDEYVSASMDKFDTWSKNTKLELDQFYVAKKLYDELVQHADEATKTKVASLIKTIRANITKHVTQSVGAQFVKNKNVDSYLHGFEQLSLIMDDVAETEADKAAAAKSRESFRSKVDKFLPAYNIDEDGFAMPAKEANLVSDFQQYGGILNYTSDGFVQEAIFVPSKNPGIISISPMGTSLKMRMFFNRPQPAGRDYGVKITVYGSPYSKSQTFMFTDAVDVTDGNASLNFQCEFDWLPSDFVPGDPETGLKNITIALGYKDENSGWKPMSNVCRFKAK